MKIIITDDTENITDEEAVEADLIYLTVDRVIPMFLELDRKNKRFEDKTLLGYDTIFREIKRILYENEIQNK